MTDRELLERLFTLLNFFDFDLLNGPGGVRERVEEARRLIREWKTKQ